MSQADTAPRSAPQNPPVLGGVAPYLAVAGALKAAEFYKRAFAAVEVGAMPPDDKGRTLHVHLVVNGGSLMLCDLFPEHGQGQLAGPGMMLHLQVDDVEAWWQRAVAAGAEVKVPLADAFWGDRYGQLRDPYGIVWSLATPLAKLAGKPAAGPGVGAAAASGSGVFTIARTFDASRAALWRAFSEAGEMRRWWGPKGFTVTKLDMDLKPGGHMHYGLRAPDGMLLWGRFVYRDIVPGERMVLVSSFSDPDGGVTRHPLAETWPIELLTTFTFLDEGGKGRLTVTWEPLHPSPAERAAFDAGHASMRNGWTGTLDQLATYLAGRGSA